MEQNLDQKERKQRLALGGFFGAISVASFLTDQGSILVGLTGVLSAGFIANYFTCFCGTKKAIKIAKNRVLRR
jgi:hypothetical protein